MRKKGPDKTQDRMELSPKQDEGSISIRAGLDSLVIGQDSAKQVLVEGLMNNVYSVSPRRGPLGTFFFYGPSGCGKTELAHALAQITLGGRERLTKIKMELFSESHSVSNLVGSPKGYIGSDSHGFFGSAIYEFAEKARAENRKNFLLARYPMFNIIVLDEIEKAHPAVHRLLLGIMDDGILKLNDGSTIDFSESIIIMTSNVGAKEKRDVDSKQSMGFVESDKKLDKAVIDREMMKMFPPEFWGRIDARVEFQDLTRNDCQKIIDVNVAKINKVLEIVSNNNPVTHLILELTQPVYEYLIDKGFCKAKGARELVRVFNREINAVFGKILVDHDSIFDFQDHDAVIVAELVENKIKFILDKNRIIKKSNIIYIPDKSK